MQAARHITPSILMLYLHTIYVAKTCRCAQLCSLCHSELQKILPRLLITQGEPQKVTTGRSNPVLLNFYCKAECTPQLTHLTHLEHVVKSAEFSCGWEDSHEQCSQTVLLHGICFSM